MKRKKLNYFVPTVCLMILFILYTAALTFIDVRPIGPQDSLVGFATINRHLHNFFGVNMLLYNITDWLGLVAIFVSIGFAVLGFVQLVKRMSFRRVDSSILVLGGFYLLVFSAYIFFEFFVVNYRPVLINGFLEASYPSSTTMLVMCIMPTAMMQFHRLIKNIAIKKCVNIFCGCFTIFMVIGRILSGVHWFTDILGGIILSVALVLLYCAVNQCIEQKTVH